MNSQPISAPPGPRPRRSYTSLPQYDGSKDMPDAPKENKKHRSRHSLHHHLPPPYRRLKESQPASSATLLGSNPFKPLTEKHENVSSVVSDSRPQSLAAIDGASESVAARDLVRAEDIERERQRTEARNNELGTTLQSLSELSMSTTRKLDDIYYSILEKASTLQSTISNLQDLSSLTKQLRHDFDDSAGNLKDDVQEQINGFGGFNVQKERIDGLEGRVERSREKADKLSERLRAAQERIGLLESREGEWQTTVNRRFTIFWSVLGAVAALIIAASIFNATNSAAGQAAMNATKTNTSSIGPSSAIPLSVRAILESEKQFETHSKTLPTFAASELEEDPRLRIFDEL